MVSPLSLLLMIAFATGSWVPIFGLAIRADFFIFPVYRKIKAALRSVA
jgi:hypothetical protein